MSHADETVTDPHVYRLRAAMTARGAVFAWDYPGATLLRVRITRSSVAPADRHSTADGRHTPDDRGEKLPREVVSEVVYEGMGGSFRDAAVRSAADDRDGMPGAAGSPPHYRIEATLDGEEWVTWHDGPV